MFLLFFLLSFLLMLSVSMKYRFLAPFLMLSLFVRVLFFFLNHAGIYVVPGGGADALHFEHRALQIYELPWADLLSFFDPSKGGTNYSVLGASLIKLSGGELLAMPAFNVLLGTIIVIITSVTAYKVWGKRSAIFVALLLSLYPFSIFNSVVSMREEASSLFGILGAAAVIYWSRNGAFYFLYIAAAFLLLAASFHPGWIGALVGLACYSLWRSTQIVRLANAGKRVSRYELSLVMSALVFVAGVTVLLSLPGLSILNLFGGYVGEDADIGDAITARFAREEALGASGYPSFITHGDPLTQPWLIPLRIFYFLFSPFPWDIRSPRHLLGFASSFLYIFIFWKVYKYWDLVKQHKELIPIIFIFAGLTFVFAVGVTNIGTAIRHKTKFFPILLLFGAVAFQHLRIKFRR